MPYARPSTIRRMMPSHALGAVAASLAATAISACLVFASSASGASEPAAEIFGPPDPPAYHNVALEDLFGAPPDLEIVDSAALADGLGFLKTIAFFHALATLPPPPPAPVVEQAPPPAAPAAAPVPTATPRPAPPPPPPPAPAPTPASGPQIGAGLDTSPMVALEQALFDATNRRRASAGLPPLRASGYLVGVARIRSQDMATNGYFAHTSPVTGDTAFSLLEAYGVPYGWAGENLAMNNYPGAETAGVADQALWDSPPHRENILNAHYTEMGIGLRVNAEGMYYFTVIFTGPA